ncbi:MAG: hypothetical protein KF749_15555 [Bacteroidetes bacterium]|nr:hypothetical protein [Bacteroidota bacterium]
MRSKITVSILLAFLAGTTLFGQENRDSLSLLQVFPGKKIFPAFTADGLAHQLSLSRVTENRDWIGAVGGSIPLAQVNAKDFTLQGSVAVTIFNRLVKRPGHLEVYTVDYKVDFPFDIRLSELALRIALGHISCHFADDVELYGKNSIQHVNDYITLSASYDLPVTGGYVYGGNPTTVLAHSRFNTNPWLFQIGGTRWHYLVARRSNPVRRVRCEGEARSRLGKHPQLSSWCQAFPTPELRPTACVHIADRV